MASQVWENPAVKWVMSLAQMLLFTFLCWLGGNIVTSVKSFSDKLDGVVKSIADIATKQVMQERDQAALVQRVQKGEAKTEALEQQVLRLGLKVEQLERESPHGRK